MKCALLVAAMLGAGVAASAQVAPIKLKPRPGPILNRPVTLPAIMAKLVSNPDGSFVSDIDGKRRNFGFRPGSVHSIRGKGFGRRSNASVLLLKSADGRYAVNLAISRWEDDLIVAQVPAGQSGFPSENQLTLMIMTGPSNGGPRQFVIRGGSFEAETGEVKLSLHRFEQRALEDAGLRVRVWNRGREFLTFERDGSVTVTRYIDFPKDKRTSPCPGPGSDRLNLTQFESALNLRAGFRLTRIAVSTGPTNGHFTGRYANAWEKVDDRTFFRSEWGVWRFRRDASFSLNKPFDIKGAKFGRHVTIPDGDAAFTACGSEYNLTFYATGPRGLSPR